MRLQIFHLFNLITFSMCATPYAIKFSTGSDVAHYIPFMAQQIITEFSHYPYLYNGNLEEEYASLNEMHTWPHTACAVVYDNDTMVGFILGTALTDYDQHFDGIGTKLFTQASLDPAAYYYISECIILPEYRGKGFSQELFKLIEDHARSLNYPATCLICESHPDGHPQKPLNYCELDGLWTKLGYTKTDLFLVAPWNTFQPDGTSRDQEHTARYWIKSLIK